MTQSERNNAYSKISTLTRGIEEKVLPKHYASLLDATHAKLMSLVASAPFPFNPKAISDQERAHEGGVSWPSSLLFCLLPGCTGYNIFGPENLAALAEWTGVPQPETPNLSSPQVNADLQLLRRYSVGRILHNFPILSILWYDKNSKLPEPKDTRPIHKVLPSHLVALCTTARTLDIS
jgi:hypothetical protein